MKKPVALSVTVIVLAAGGLALRSHLNRGSDHPAIAAAEEPSAAGAAAVTEAAPVAPSASGAPGAVVTPAVPAPGAPVAASPETGGVYKSELDSYELIKSKVFLSDDDRIARARLLNDPQLIRGLESLLRTPAAIGSEQAHMQNQALDLLFDAQQGDTADVANEVLRSVIQDPTIENESLPEAVRRPLAGIKAEVLYHWSSIDPNKSGEIQSWLTGPVAQKLWENVRQMQQQNLAESALTR